MCLRRFDGDTSLLLVLSRVCDTSFTGLGASNDTGFRDQGIGQSGLAVIDVRNNGHVADVVLFVHNGTDLVHCKVHLNNGRETC